MTGNFQSRFCATNSYDATVSFDSIKGLLPAIFRTVSGRKSVKFITRPNSSYKHAIDSQRYLSTVNDSIRPISSHTELITLPAHINVFPNVQLNKDLYFWLAIFFASYEPHQLHSFDDPLLEDLNFIRHSYHTALRAQIFYADFVKRYTALAKATLVLREDCDLSPLEKEVEGLIQSLLGSKNSKVKTGHAFFDFAVHGIPLPRSVKAPLHYAPAQALPLWGEIHYNKPDVYFDRHQNQLRNQHTCLSK